MSGILCIFSEKKKGGERCPPVRRSRTAGEDQGTDESLLLEETLDEPERSGHIIAANRDSQHQPEFVWKRDEP